MITPTIDQGSLQFQTIDLPGIVLVDVAENVLNFRTDGSLLGRRRIPSILARVTARLLLPVASVLLPWISTL